MQHDSMFEKFVAEGKPVGEIIGIDSFLIKVRGLQPTNVHALVRFEDGSKGYVHHVYEAPDVADVSEPGYVAKRRVPSYTQTDLQLGYRLPELANSEVQLGVRNLTDRQPPLIYSGFNASTDMRTYDAIGRFYWMRWTARF